MIIVLDPSPYTSGDLGLAQQQLRAIDCFVRERARAEQVTEIVARTRELRMDRDRRMQVLRREHEALIRRAHAHLLASGDVLGTVAPMRAVIAHRNTWFTTKLGDLLISHGLQVVETVDNGADAIGTVVAEQPDVIFVEEGLLMVTGEEVVRQSRRFCPGTRIGAQASCGSRVGLLLDAGADAVVTRQVTPREVVDQLLGQLVG